jgi:hypothetical protein
MVLFGYYTTFYFSSLRFLGNSGKRHNLQRLPKIFLRKKRRNRVLDCFVTLKFLETETHS